MHSSFEQVPSISPRGVLETEIGPDPKNPLNRGVMLVEECFKVAMELKLIDSNEMGQFERVVVLGSGANFKAMYKYLLDGPSFLGPGQIFAVDLLVVDNVPPEFAYPDTEEGAIFRVSKFGGTWLSTTSKAGGARWLLLNTSAFAGYYDA